MHTDIAHAPNPAGPAGVFEYHGLSTTGISLRLPITHPSQPITMNARIPEAPDMSNTAQGVGDSGWRGGGGGRN
jgi:hypothetical protein